MHGIGCMHAYMHAYIYANILACMHAHRHTMEQKISHCKLMDVQKEASCTCQAKKVVGSSFTPIVALLVWHRTTHSGLSWIYTVTNMMPVKADPARCSSANSISGWYESVAFTSSKNGLSVLVLLCLVLAITVTTKFYD